MTQMNICKRKRLRDVEIRPEVVKGEKRWKRNGLGV